MIERLSKCNFSYQDLVNAYKISEKDAIILLEGKINGKSQIIKTLPILNKILNHLKSVSLK